MTQVKSQLTETLGSETTSTTDSVQVRVRVRWSVLLLVSSVVSTTSTSEDSDLVPAVHFPSERKVDHYGKKKINPHS